METPTSPTPRAADVSPGSRSNVASKRSLFRARTEEELLSGAASNAWQVLADAAHRIEPFKLDGSLLRQGAVGELQWIPGDGDVQEATNKQELHGVTEAFVWVSGLVAAAGSACATYRQRDYRNYNHLHTKRL